MKVSIAIDPTPEGYKKIIYFGLLFFCTTTVAQKIGIGTVNPDFPLTIQADANQGVLSFKSSGGNTKWHWWMPFGTDLMLTETGVADNRLSIKSGGYVGIGPVNPPFSLLNVFDPQIDRNIARFKSGGGWGQILVSNGTITSDLGADQSKGYVGTNSDHDFIVRSGGDDVIMVKHGTGHVGIGTNSPAARLQVNGNAIIDGTLTVSQQPALNNVQFFSGNFSNEGFPFENVTYYKDAEGRVHLSGVVKITGSQLGAMFILPAGYRPVGDLPFACMTASGVAHRINVNAGGHVTIGIPEISGWVSVSGISFRAAP